MKDAPETAPRLVPVVRRGTGFVESPFSVFLGDEAELSPSFLRLIRDRYARTTSEVEIGGQRTEAFVYQSPHHGDAAYVIVAHGTVEGSPDDTDLETSRSEFDYLAAWRSLVYEEAVQSDALAPGNESHLWSQFIPPTFYMATHGDARGITVTWHDLRRQSRLVILGGPGTGKTTSLRRLTLELLREQEDDPAKPTPIYVQARMLTGGTLDAESLARVVSGDNDRLTVSELEWLLSTGRAAVLVDGLDEVPQEFRKTVQRSIAELGQMFPQLSIILSTRPEAYDWSFSDFAHAQLAPFDDKQVAELAWNRLYGESTDIFLRELREVQEVRELARTPLFLETAIFSFRRSGVTPSSWSRLYRRFVGLLIDEWDQVRGVQRSRDPRQAPEEKLDALCRVAAGSLLADKHQFTDEDYEHWYPFDEAFSVLTPQLLAEHTGLIRRVTNGSWCFTHASFAEYLASQYFVRSTEDATVTLVPRLSIPTWQRIATAVCSLTVDADPLMNDLLTRGEISHLPRARMIAEVLSQSPKVSRDIKTTSAATIARALQRVVLEVRRTYEPDAKEVTSHYVMLALNPGDAAEAEVEVAEVLRLFNALRMIRSKTFFVLLSKYPEPEETRKHDLSELLGALGSAETISIDRSGGLLALSLVSRITRKGDSESS